MGAEAQTPTVRGVCERGVGGRDRMGRECFTEEEGVGRSAAGCRAGTGAGTGAAGGGGVAVAAGLDVELLAGAGAAEARAALFPCF